MNKYFSFGENWKKFFKFYVNEKIVLEAASSLLKYFPKEQFKNKTFIDVGCGSGLFSLGALLLGCKEVHSFDIDKESVRTTEKLKKQFDYLLKTKNQDFNWEIFQGNILDNNLINRLYQKGDIVYAWGSLHHTGAMWQSIKNTMKIVKPMGYFIIAIYNYAPSSPFWLKVKKFYNRQNKFIRSLLIFFLFLEKFIGRTLLLKSPLKEKRGMSIFYDTIDWLGGYPYEFSCFDEIKNFIEKLGFKFIKAPTKISCGKGKKINLLSKIRSKDTGNNEFVFQKIK